MSLLSENGGDDRTPEAEKSSGVTLHQIGLERARILPVAESFSIVIGTTAEREDE